MRAISPDVETARREEFIARLALALDQSGLTVEEVTYRANQKESYVRKLFGESDTPTRDPGFFKIMAIAAVVGADPFWLALIVDEPAPRARIEAVPRKAGGR